MRKKAFGYAPRAFSEKKSRVFRNEKTFSEGYHDEKSREEGFYRQNEGMQLYKIIIAGNRSTRPAEDRGPGRRPLIRNIQRAAPGSARTNLTAGSYSAFPSDPRNAEKFFDQLPKMFFRSILRDFQACRALLSYIFISVSWIISHLLSSYRCPLRMIFYRNVACAAKAIRRCFAQRRVIPRRSYSEKRLNNPIRSCCILPNEPRWHSPRSEAREEQSSQKIASLNYTKHIFCIIAPIPTLGAFLLPSDILPLPFTT